MICPRCGAATWNYNTGAGTRMCVNGHQTDENGTDIPFTATYTQASVPVAVPPTPSPVIVKGASNRAVAVIVAIAVVLTQVVERLVS